MRFWATHSPNPCGASKSRLYYWLLHVNPQCTHYHICIGLVRGSWSACVAKVKRLDGASSRTHDGVIRYRRYLKHSGGEFLSMAISVPALELPRLLPSRSCHLTLSQWSIRAPLDLGAHDRDY